jgi:outer membrane lipoprotein-sorting protein
MLHKTLLGTGGALLLAAGTVLAQAPAAKPGPGPTPQPAVSAPATALPSADEIIARHIAARGGMDKLKSVQTVRMSGKMAMGPGIEVPIALELKRPSRMRMEMTFQGMTGIQAYDAGTGWMVMPFSGRTDPQPMSPDDLKDAEEMSDLDGALVDYKTKGHSVELLGKEKVEGTDAYKLRITLKNGDQRTVYLESESFMEIRQEGKRKIRGSDVEIEASMGDFKEVGGIIFPHSIEQAMKGNPQKQKITIDKIEINPSVDDSRFKMPAPAPSPSPSPAAKQ